MSVAKFLYENNRVNINVTFQGKNESLDQKMLVDTGFKEEGIVSEEVASKFRLSEAGIKNMGFGLGMGHFFSIRISTISQIPDMKFYTHSETEARLKKLKFDGLVGLEFLKKLRYEGDSTTFYLKNGQLQGGNPYS